jgi:hypothetical protein
VSKAKGEVVSKIILQGNRRHDLHDRQRKKEKKTNIKVARLRIVEHRKIRKKKKASVLIKLNTLI